MKKPFRRSWRPADARFWVGLSALGFAWLTFVFFLTGEVFPFGRRRDAGIAFLFLVLCGGAAFLYQDLKATLGRRRALRQAGVPAAREKRVALRIGLRALGLLALLAGFVALFFALPAATDLGWGLRWRTGGGWMVGALALLAGLYAAAIAWDRREARAVIPRQAEPAAKKAT